MRIAHNLSAMNSHRQLGTNNVQTAKSMEKLSTGFRINRAGDDAAGLFISEKMRGQIRGLDMATKNAQDDISLVQTAEGALTETHDILQRVRELSVQSANDTNLDTGDREAIQLETTALISEVTRIASSTQFNKQILLMGDFADKKFHIGANADQAVTFSIEDMSASGLAVDGVDLKSQDGANTAITTVDEAISKVSLERAKIGAIQNRLEHTVNNLQATSENLQASESRIRDVDMAKEMMNFTKNNILSQAAQSMLAQANQQPQGVLQLLR